MKYLIILIMSIFCLYGCNKQEQIEDVACKYVSVIIQDEWNDLAKTNKAFRRYMVEKHYTPATCAAVKLGEPIRKNYWHNATAYLHNGTEINITVELKNGNVYVSIVDNLFGWWR